MIHHQFAAVAAVRPQTVAVRDTSSALTYRELDERAAAVAGALVRRGIRPGTRVAVCMDRTVDYVAAVLGVLRAGGCFVPLDPWHPAQWRARTLTSAAIAHAVIDATTADDFLDIEEIEAWDFTMLLGSDASGELPAGVVTQPAYIIHTSGTTGRPKGVVIPHRNVLALVEATRELFALSTRDVWTMFHSAAFDFSVWEMFGSLLTGGTLVMVPHWTARDPEHFADLLEDSEVTVLSQTPSSFAKVRDHLLARDLGRRLRLIVFGGEALDPRMLREWMASRHPAQCRLVNMYGITETTVHVTARYVEMEDAIHGSCSVGRPLPGWEVSVRDEYGHPGPVGVAGEIWVAGAGLASGYLGQPELTAARFVTDAASGTRFYRSGDLGRLDIACQLDHLGRVDNQVKIYGHRVETHEVRTALVEDPAVSDAVVDVVSGDAGPQLHGYLVLARPDTTVEVRRRLAARLPGYMIPASLTAVTEIPLNANGKADLTRLRADAAASRPACDELAASNPAAGDLAAGGTAADIVMASWRDIFGDADPSLTFFDLGGNSMLALRLVTRLRERGSPPVGPRDVYLHPTAVDLAAVLSGRQNKSSRR